MKPHIESKSITHRFTPEEIAGLHNDLLGALESLDGINSELDDLKATYKAKITSAEAHRDSLRVSIRSGCELRTEKCRVVFVPSKGEKLYFLENAPEDATPVHKEPMTPRDYELELVQADSDFECVEFIPLFQPTGNDTGCIAIGRKNDRWYTALRVVVGSKSVAERFDAEQKAPKKRPDAVKSACKRAFEWLLTNLGKENAEGFKSGVDAIIDQNKERAE